MEDWNAWYPSQPVPTVDAEAGPKWSGLFDQTGRKLYRPAPSVGFHIPKARS
jgi:hypothetical protein